jgi:hypothetical protein
MGGGGWGWGGPGPLVCDVYPVSLYPSSKIVWSRVLFRSLLQGFVRFGWRVCSEYV